MADVEMIEIHNWKNPAEKWLISAQDFDPQRHVRWGEWPAAAPSVDCPSSAVTPPAVPPSRPPAKRRR